MQRRCQHRERTAHNHVCLPTVLEKSFIEGSDHKPIEMIAVKNLANVPPHLQQMLLQHHHHHQTQPGKEMFLANALAYCPVRASPEIKLDVWVDNIAFNKAWIEKHRDTTSEDPFLGSVI